MTQKPELGILRESLEESIATLMVILTCWKAANCNSPENAQDVSELLSSAVSLNIFPETGGGFFPAPPFPVHNSQTLVIATFLF